VYKLSINPIIQYKTPSVVTRTRDNITYIALIEIESATALYIELNETGDLNMNSEQLPYSKQAVMIFKLPPQRTPEETEEIHESSV
jgi:hypothetical protein